MRLVLDRIEDQQSGSTKLKQFAGDLADTLKSTYEKKIRPGAMGGIPGAGKFSSSFLGSLGFTGLAESVKENAEAKEAKRQEKEKFVGDFQQYSDAGKTLSSNTARDVAESLYDEIEAKTKELKKLQEEADKQKKAGYGVDPENAKKQEELLKAIQAIDPRNKGKGASDKDIQAVDADNKKIEDGKKQEEIIKALDPNKNQGSSDKNIQAVQADEAKIETAEKQKETFEVNKKEQEDLTALYTITDDHFKKQDKWNEDSMKLLETIAANGTGGGGGGGGLLSSAAEMAGDLMGNGKGKGGGKLGKLGKVGKFLTGNAGKIAGVGAGLLSVGTAAYEGYNEYNQADEQVKSGEITKEQGQEKKGEAVGGAVGGAAGGWAGASTGASAGAAIGTLLFPGVGTVIGGALGAAAGGALGYWGGKKVGQTVGGGAVKGYQALGGNDPNSGAMENVDAMGNPTGMSSDSSPPSNADPKKDKLARDWAWSIMTEQAGDKKPDASIKAQVDTIMKTDTQLQTQAKAYLENKKAGAKKVDKSQQISKVEAQPERVSPDTGNALAQRTNEVEDARSAAQNNSNIVNAPQSSVTNITNNNGGGKESSKPSARNDETTYQRYLDRRYYPMRDF